MTDPRPFAMWWTGESTVEPPLPFARSGDPAGAPDWRQYRFTLDAASLQLLIKAADLAEPTPAVLALAGALLWRYDDGHGPVAVWCGPAAGSAAGSAAGLRPMGFGQGAAGDATGLLRQVGALVDAALRAADSPSGTGREPAERAAEQPAEQPFAQVAVLAGTEADTTGAEPPLPPGTAPRAFTLVLCLVPRSMDVVAWYDARRLPAQAPRQFGAHLASLLSAAAAHPGRPLRRLPLLPDAERTWLLRQVNATDRPLTDATTVQEAFERCVQRDPDAIAAVAGRATLTYAELSGQATALARELRARGAGPETLVAVYLPPGTELLAAIVGTLKAGGAFVPVDPDYPRQRTASLLSMLPGSIVVTTAALAGELPPGRQTVIVTDKAPTAAVGDTAPGSGPGIRARPDSLACVLFTSASTGESKGVAITHRGLLNLAFAAADRFGLTPADRFLQLASTSFSAFLEEVFPSLVTGATVVLAGYREGMRSVPGLLALLTEKQITAFGITTAHWHQLVDDLSAEPNGLPGTVRMVLMGSERATPDRVAAWCRIGVPLVHVYGPTETTATATYFHLGEESTDAERGFVLPIGRAIPNTQVYVLDDELEPVPRGLPGQVYLGGASLARGYLGSPALTASRFVPDPFRAGGRLYRTGDVARYLPDGNLEFLNRDSSLAKVHGCRVNPAEVEAALEAQPGVRQAVVTVAETAVGDSRLIAHLTGLDERGLDTRALRERLLEQLPDYMVPAMITQVDGLPLTANGKVDRAALAALAAGEPSRTGDFTEPATGTQRAVAQIWSEVLGAGQLGAEDSFFDLGGDSLSVTRILTRIRRQLGIDLEPAQVFGARTVAGLATLIDTAAGPAPAADQAHGPDLDPGQWRSRSTLISRALNERTGLAAACPISVSQQGPWVMSQLDESASYPVAWRCTIRGQVDVAAFGTAVAEVARRHEPLRSWFAVVGGQPLQVVADLPADDLFAVVNLPGRISSDRRLAVDLACREAAKAVLDVSRPALCRVRLLCVDDQEHVLLCVVHHLVFDNWSIGMFLRDLVSAYEATVAGQPASWQPLQISYADFAVWQRSRLAGEAGKRHLGYWRDQLRGSPGTRLPHDHPRAADDDFAGAITTLGLRPELRDTVRDLAVSQGSTPFIVLLAAFYVLLCRYADGTDICVGSPIANRTVPETEPLIGYFVNLVGLRADLAGDPSFREIVRRVTATCLSAYEHQELPLDMVVQDLRPTRIPGANPLFQATFSVDPDMLPDLSTAGFTLEPVEEVGTGRVRSGYDLIWLVIERPGELSVRVDYRTRLFERETVETMIRDYGLVLARACADPETALSAFTPATVSMEAALCLLWADAFGRPDIAPDDDFFELGGSSLLAANVVGRIRELLGVNVTLRAFFESATIGALAARIATDYGIAEADAERLRSVRDNSALEDALAGLEGMSDGQVTAALTQQGRDQHRE